MSIFQNLNDCQFPFDIKWIGFDIRWIGIWLYVCLSNCKNVGWKVKVTDDLSRLNLFIINSYLNKLFEVSRSQPLTDYYNNPGLGNILDIYENISHFQN